MKPRTVQLILDEEKRRNEEWRASPLRRYLLGSFFGFLGLFLLVLVFYSLPLSVTADTTMCSTTVTTVKEGPKLKPVSVEEEISCERRGLPTWFLAAGPIVLATPLVALVVHRPGRFRATMKGPGGDDAVEVEATDGLTSIIAAIGDSTKKSAQDFPGAP